MPDLPPGAPVTVSELADHLSMTPTQTDESASKLARHLAAALDVVESVCGPLAVREVTHRVLLEHGRGLLPEWPVVSVVSAAGVDGTTAAVAHTSGGAVTSTTSQWVDVTYQVGRPNPPASLLLAVYIVAGHLWETQRGRSARPQQGNVPEQVLMGFAVPARAAQLMTPYRSPRIGAA